MKSDTPFKKTKKGYRRQSIASLNLTPGKFVGDVFFVAIVLHLTNVEKEECCLPR